MDEPWLTDSPPAARRRTPTSNKVALVGAGVIAGALLAGTMAAGASSTASPATPAAATPATPEGAQAYDHPGGGRGFHFGATGTVTAVGTSTVTIKTSSGTKTYQVTAGSDIFKNGLAKLSDLKSGDAVRFSTTTANGDTVDRLIAGNPPFSRFGRPPGGFRFGATGTVTAVSTSTVTIKTSSGTKTYQVTGGSDIDKNGEAKLSDLKVGDAVRFSTTTANGDTIDKLHAGNEAARRPGGFPGFPGGHGRGPGFGGFGGSTTTTT